MYKFKYENTLIITIIVLITVNLASSTYVFQKRQDLPPGPCKDCIDKCCTSAQECVKGQNNLDACKSDYGNCIDNCNSGACSNTSPHEIQCQVETSPSPP